MTKSIVIPCAEPRCGVGCRACDGNGYSTAVVSPWTVTIDGHIFDRGEESEARISEACRLVDSDNADELAELLLRCGAEP